MISVAATERRQRRRALAQEAAALEANPEDRAEMLEVAAMMEALTASK